MSRRARQRRTVVKPGASGKEVRRGEEYVLVPRSLLLEIYGRLEEIQRKLGGDAR